MLSPSSGYASADRKQNGIYKRVGEVIRVLVNPVDYFSGAKLAATMVADNIVVFKRTSVKMLKPRGVTHNYHHRFELVIPLLKAARIHVDGAAYMLAPGQVFLIFPHQFHHYLDIEDGEMNWLFITFEFSRPQALLPLRNSPRVFVPAEVEKLRQMLDVYLQKAPGPERNFKLIVNMSELIQRLLSAREADCAVEPNSSEDDPKGTILQAINAYVRANLNKPLTIADLAKHTGYSISHLRAVFRREYGVSLGGYMRDSRLSAAAAMLARGERGSIESIAKVCGFVSIFSFSRAFKKAMGLSPSAYKKFVNGSAPKGTSPRSIG
jgi:AraC-like DNA-binding protein